MPAIDKCEESIIKALEKEGWRVLRRPLSLSFQKKRYLYADISLENANAEQIIIVEVKCFPPESPELDELYRAIGQYVLYRSILMLNKNNTPLFLAIPNETYEGLFQIKAVQRAIKDAKIKLVVVDLEREEVKVWKS